MKAGKSVRILVIEDDADAASLLQKLFEKKFSAKVDTADTCASARKMFPGGVYDVITLDHKLPDGNGLELLDEITATEEHPPVIMVTGHGGEKVASRAWRAGASGYVRKDKNLAGRLTEAVEKALARASVKRANEALEKERAITEAALNFADDIFFVSDLENRLVRWNRKVSEVSGLSDEELSGATRAFFYKGKEHERITQSLQRVLDKGYDRLELTYPSKDGEEIPYEISLTLITDNDGNPTGVCGVGRDISERKRAEERLRSVIMETNERREEITTLLDSTRSVLEFKKFEDAARAIFNRLKKLVGASAGYVALLDKTGKENKVLFIEPEQLGADVDPLLRMPVGRLSRKALDSGKTVYENAFDAGEWMEGLPQGHFTIDNVLFAPLTVEGRAAGLMGLANKPGGFTNRDALMASAFGEIAAVALRNSQTLEKLEKSEAEYRAVVEGQTELICRYLPGGTITFANDTYCRYFGKGREELIGHVFLPRIHEEDYDYVQERFALLTGDKPVVTIEHRVVRPDGDVRWHRWINHAIFDDEGNIIEFQAVGRDVTERKEAEQALRESEGRYRGLFENAPDSIYSISKDGRLTSLNPAFEKLTGWSREEWLEKNFAELIHPDDLAKAVETFQQASSGQTPPLYELRIRTKSGEYRVGEFVSTPLVEGSEVVGELGIARDVTKRRQTSEALEESEEMYRSLVDVSPDAIIVSGIDEMITNVSKRAVEMLGYESEDEIVGLNVFDLFAPEERGKAAENRRRRLEGGTTGLVNYTMLKKDGTRLDVELSATAFHDSSGNPGGVIGIARDITDRKRADEELRESRELYRTLLQTSPDAVVVTDLEGKIIEASRRAAELNRSESEDDLIGRNAFDLIAPEDHEKAVKHLQNTLEEGALRKLEYTLVRKDGSTFIGEMSTALLKGGEGNPSAFIATIRDITERKRAEEELQRMNIELEEYAHAVSHDLKSPLASLSAASETLQLLVAKSESGEAFPDVVEMAEIINRDVKKANKLIDELLDIAKAGQIPGNVGDVDVTQIVTRVLSELEDEIRKKRIRVKVDSDLGRIRANNTQVYQVFSNLIGNAVAHNDSKEPVVLVLYLGDEPGGGHRYLVKDNGSGITPDDLDHIFRPLYAGEGGKSGIGLATVDKIVKVYDGSVSAYNDGGACLEFVMKDMR